MFNKFKNNIRKYIRKYIPFVFSLLLIPCLSINAFAYNISYPFHQLSLKNIYASAKVNNNYGTINQFTFPQGDDNVYWISNLQLNNVQGFRFNLYADTAESDRFFSFPVNTDLYDYYFVGSFFYNQNAVLSPLTISDVRLSSGNVYNNVMYDQNYYTLSDVSVLPFTGVFARGSTFSGKIDNITSDSSISFVELDFSQPTNINARLWFNFLIIYVPKDTNKDAINDIVSAINYQNSLLENGSSDTQSAVSDFNQVFQDFNEELENWEQFDDEIIGEFNAANDDYKTQLNNFSLSGSLLNAGNWLSTSMQTVYDNSSDYKMLWLVPLLFGIPILLFIIRKTGDDE